MFDWKDLNERIRQLMLEEVDADSKSNCLYYSSKLSAQGRVDYLPLLRDTVLSGDETTFATALNEAGRLNSRQEPRFSNGTFSVPRMSSNAAEVLAEGEFNRFYIRAVCLRAIELNQETVIIYRASLANEPRWESEQLIGRQISASALLKDLRQIIGRTRTFKIPEPGSGLSVCLP